MNEPKISDNSSIQKTLKQAQRLVALKCVLPFAAPLLKVLGVDADKIKTDLEMADNLAQQAQELATVPDKFNDYFGKRGWIIYESLSLEVAKKAIAVADTGDIDAAEQILVDYFTPATVRLWLNQMKAVKAFQPRFRLAQLALKDYEEERYHACIPVILALMDGLVNELNNGRGFFSDVTELEAWDSISAHKRGLVELGAIFKQGRNKTRTEQITIPYRNGILHGNDLSYDNKIVATKTWAALFALRDWAIKAEGNKLEEPLPKSSPSILDALNQHRKTQKTKQKIQDWKPRIFTDQESFLSEDPSDYDVNTPERKLVEFLRLWKAKNYGHMAGCVQVKPGASAGEMPKRVRDVLGEVELIGFQIVQIDDTAAAATDIFVTLRYIFNQSQKEKAHKFRLLYMNSEGNGEVRSEQGHQWYILNWEYFHPYSLGD
ncbi:MAG: hypothetical protein J0L63_16020 [Anaerolineae bacterium]|nr:hypothetical protein [Anaerolineae bacterium]